MLNIHFKRRLVLSIFYMYKKKERRKSYKATTHTHTEKLKILQSKRKVCLAI